MIDLSTYRPRGDKRNTPFFEEHLPRVYGRRASSGLDQLVGTMAAPEARARAVARATMLGYAGYFVGPPLVGMIAGGLGLRSAFVFTAALLGFVWLLAPLLVRLKPTRSV